MKILIFSFPTHREIAQLFLQKNLKASAKWAQYSRDFQNIGLSHPMMDCFSCK